MHSLTNRFLIYSLLIIFQMMFKQHCTHTCTQAQGSLAYQARRIHLCTEIISQPFVFRTNITKGSGATHSHLRGSLQIFSVLCTLPSILTPLLPTRPGSGERCLLDHNKQCLYRMYSFFFFFFRLFPSRNMISELMLVSQLWEVRLSSKIHVIHFLLNYLPP